MRETNDERNMRIDGLSCICGYNKIYYTKINVGDTSGVNQLACPNCGIIMRSPSSDENGDWLKKHWARTHSLKERESGVDSVILATHCGRRKKYAFRVPEALAAYCHRRDDLLVETRYGLRIVRAETKVLRDGEAEVQAEKVGGWEALRPVVGVITPQIRQHVREQAFDELVRKLQHQMFAERWALRELEAGSGG